MNGRKLKKACAAGNLIAVKGTQCVFMSLGIKNKNEVDSFNGIDISTGEFVRIKNGIMRPATNIEKKKYWDILKRKCKQLQ